MVSLRRSHHCRFTVHTTGKPSVLSHVLNVLGGYGMEPAWLLTHTKSKRTFRLDVGLAGASSQTISAVAARLTELYGVKKVQVEMPGRTVVPDNRDPNG